jgi:hypothetical protein
MVGGDFDGDGDAEVIVGGDAGSQLSVLGRGTDLTLTVETTFAIGAVVHQLEVADLDLDGRLDLLVGVDGGLKLLRNVSTGSGYAFEVPAGTPAVVGSGSSFGATRGRLRSRWRHGPRHVRLRRWQPAPVARHAGGLRVRPGGRDRPRRRLGPGRRGRRRLHRRRTAGPRGVARQPVGHRRAAQRRRGPFAQFLTCRSAPRRTT